jgi:hypothetical protein
MSIIIISALAVVGLAHTSAFQVPDVPRRSTFRLQSTKPINGFMRKTFAVSGVAGSNSRMKVMLPALPRKRTPSLFTSLSGDKFVRMNTTGYRWADQGRHVGHVKFPKRPNCCSRTDLGLH